jgi:hypothetical protein
MRAFTRTFLLLFLTNFLMPANAQEVQFSGKLDVFLSEDQKWADVCRECECCALVPNSLGESNLEDVVPLEFFELLAPKTKNSSAIYSREDLERLSDQVAATNHEGAYPHSISNLADGTILDICRDCKECCMISSDGVSIDGSVLQSQSLKDRIVVILNSAE